MVIPSAVKKNDWRGNKYQSELISIILSMNGVSDWYRQAMGALLDSEEINLSQDVSVS